MYEMREREVRLQARIFDLDDGLERLEAMAEMREQEVAAEAEKGMPSTGLSCSELETLTCRTAESRDTGECDADGEGECCAICIMEYAPGQRICTLQCEGGHHFHQSCIHQWLAMSQLCPLCKTPALGSASAAEPERQDAAPAAAQQPLRRALEEAVAESSSGAQQRAQQRAWHQARQQAHEAAGVSAAHAHELIDAAAPVDRLPLRRPHIPSRLARIVTLLPPGMAAFYAPAAGPAAEQPPPRPPQPPPPPLPRPSFARPLYHGPGAERKRPSRQFTAPRRPPISSASHAASSTSPSDRQLPRRGAAMPSRKQRAPPPATAPPRTAERTEERNTSSSEQRSAAEATHTAERTEERNTSSSEQRSAAEATHTAEAPGGHSASNSASRSVGASAVPRRRTNVRGGVGPRAAVELGAGTARHRRPPAVGSVSGGTGARAASGGFVKVRSADFAPHGRCSGVRAGSAALLGALGVPVPQWAPLGADVATSDAHAPQGFSRGGARPRRAQLELRGMRVGDVAIA